jgi:hypothetical protein
MNLEISIPMVQKTNKLKVKSMDKNIKLLDAGISVVSRVSWNVFAKNISLTYGFDEKQGLVLEQYDNLAGKRPVHYNIESYNILPFDYQPSEPWILESAEICPDVYGGKPVLKLNVTLTSMDVRVYFHAVAFPGTSVIRQWFDLENIGISRNIGFGIKPFRMNFSIDDYTDTYRCSWFRGGKPDYDHGLICSEALGARADIHLHSRQHYDYVPMLLVLRENGPCDGFMVALDYCGIWSLDVKRNCGSVSLEFVIDDNKMLILEPGERFELPVITLGVYGESLDEFMKLIYDWQYTYLWDYTNSDYYAKPRNLGRWIYNSRNLHEQFAYRLAVLNMQAKTCQEAGFVILWDDAGWSVYPGWPPDSYGSVFRNIYEGPDFRQSQRFFTKCGIRWCLWFAGKPTLGLLASKEGAWGSFEWRTDAVDVLDIREERELKGRIKSFLEGNPQRSFHTCSGGGTYAHTFNIQRYANYNYSADMGAGPYGNYYLSYFEIPDKWGDILCWPGRAYMRKDGASVVMSERMHVSSAPLQESEVSYASEFARARLAMVPLPGPTILPSDIEATRKDLEIYRYLISQGVAGRWSYVFHPEVFGDREYYYMQRTSHDFKRCCIILRHSPQKPITIYPKNLLPDEPYHIGFQNNHLTTFRTGRDLMENGLRMENVQDGELVYLNLPGRPGSGVDVTRPEAPSSAVCRLENNIGHTGIGIYWSPGQDDNWISVYEVSRNDVTIGRISTGQYYFDFALGWDIDATYAVRTVDGDGNCSPWREARWIDGENLEFSALGGHSDMIGFNGWSAETSTDMHSFIPMKWVPPEKNPAADLGGTPNQPGGAEGYWEGGICARIGRGWQQASPVVYCIRKYTITADGCIQVIGRAMKEWYHQNKGPNQRICIFHNDHSIWPENGWAELKSDDLYGADHDLHLKVKKGDTLRFVVDKSTGGDEDLLPWLERVNLIGWIPRIVYKSETKGLTSNHRSMLRINCGSNSAITDDEGNVWAADQYFKGGTEATVISESHLLKANTALLLTARVGEDIFYDLPVSPGLYSVRLCFARHHYRWNGEYGMDLKINGTTVDTGFDVIAACRGAQASIEKVYNYIVPNDQGKIQIHLIARKGEALINAIEIASQLKDVVRINCGSEQQFIDWAGFVWDADRYFKGGASIKADGSIAQATPTIYDQGLYLTGRSGSHIEYRIPVKPSFYSVHLKFAEMWLETKGERRLDIAINGRSVKKKWDPAETAERLRMASDLRFEDISSVDEYITITIDATGKKPAVIQAIEIE